MMDTKVSSTHPPFLQSDILTVFGYKDGISQPAVAGFNTSPEPGQLVVSPGVILVGQPGDTVPRPTWATDGSFLAFRQLKQLVPEFNTFVDANAPPVAGLTVQQSQDLLGKTLSPTPGT